MSTTTTSAADVLLAGLDDDAVLTLPDVAALIPGRRRGQTMSRRVVLRWHIRGVRGHRLRTLRVGVRHLVRIADLRAFLVAIAPGADRPAPRPSPSALSRRRARRADIAERAAREALR